MGRRARTGDLQGRSNSSWPFSLGSITEPILQNCMKLVLLYEYHRKNSCLNARSDTGICPLRLQEEKEVWARMGEGIGSANNHI